MDSAALIAGSAARFHLLDMQAVARDKRKFDEAQTDAAAREREFRDQVALLEELRCSIVVQERARSKHPKAWGQKPTNRANLSAAHSQVDDVLDHIAALRAFIPHPHSLTPPVPECQCQADDKELLRKQRAQNLNGEGGSASGRSTPSRRCIAPHRALKQFNLALRPRSQDGPRIHTAQQLLNAKERLHAQSYDAAYSPAHRADASDSLAKRAEWIRFTQVAEGVVDCTTFLKGTQHLVELLAAGQISELNASDSRMPGYYKLNLDGAVLAIQNTGGNPGFFRDTKCIELAMLPRILAAVAIMVIHPLCACDCTLL